MYTSFFKQAEKLMFLHFLSIWNFWNNEALKISLL